MQESADGQSARRTVLLLSALFFFSGATALSAEVVLSRLLSYVFGSSHLATSTVLAAYMSGLTVGAYLASKYTARIRRPIFAYGILELCVALFLVLLPELFRAIQRYVIALTIPFAESQAALTLIRFGVSFILVMIPTVLMGATLPILVSAFRDDAVGKRLPVLYAANNLGAAAGTLVCSYIAIRTFGLDGTLRVCALINVAIALISFKLSPEPAEVRTEGQPEPDTAESDAELSPRFAAGLAFTQGFTVFALEVVWFHLIGTVIGVTTYAFAIMLAAILLGIGLGSLALPLIRRLTGLSSLQLFCWAQVTMAAGVAISLFFWDRFPDVISLSLRWSPEWSFFAREVVRFAFILLLLLPTTVGMGVALPAVAAAAKRDSEKRSGELVGRIFAANTVGTISGSLTCGFLLLGRLPSADILRACALLALVAAAVPHVRAADRIRRQWVPGFAAASAAVVVALLIFPGWNVQRLTSGSHYYWTPYEPAPNTELIHVAEDAQSGFVTVVQSQHSGENTPPLRVKTMQTNGKYEGSDEPMEFQDLFALLGAPYLKKTERSMLIGLGPGRTLAIICDLPFKHIEAVEHSPAIIDAARAHFPDFAGRAMADTPRVRVYCDDGRNHLQLSPHLYDFIAVGITGAAFSGTGNIYNADFFNIVSSHLQPDGIFMMWVQIHHVFDHDVRSVIYTLNHVFPHVHFYSTGNQGFLIASRQKLAINTLLVRALDSNPAIQKTLQRNRISSILDLLQLNIFSSEPELKAYFASSKIAEAPLIYSDFFPTFEYSTPFGLATKITGYNFQPLSLKRLPEFEPPLPAFEYHTLSAYRYAAGGDLKGAIRSLELAQKEKGSPVYQKQIEELKKRSSR
ncbi:MAG TPA: fused MFS/spermidine synthase [Planctomycetota bacterium]|nr:fused MFS/spermidine synthase [Planctomycetota bacterium]